MTKATVYCVIVTYNGEQWIRKCLSSLVNSSLLPHIYVVDNGSTDNTVSIIQQEYPQVELNLSPDNLGFGQANNKGMLAALDRDADYVLLLNQDAWVEADTIENLITIHQQNTGYGILSPVHVNASHTAIDHNFSSYIVPRHCPDLYSDLYFNKLRDVYECDFVNAAAWLISKECLQTVGLFDKVFFHYGEDRNYCQRLLFHKLRIGVCPGLTVVHDREERKGVTEAFLGVKERIRIYLVKLADINDDTFEKAYSKLVSRHLYNLIKTKLKGKSKEYAYHSELYKFLKSKKAEIIQSRQNNKKKYLQAN
ncbi:glycosyltransferase family 2 protein [Mucilaginibacter sp. JRF]|uniref:glycosyltransferase family 2 protein n=1 Tax=Mucilaginibacter sp. JRF TaxID=2780088 RepID=UPI001881663E|nr:glycosyltransferase family 2 protein [Mucilaginibacter sp. JRF]MBE9585363.1 glycosyltransferase family 2 protein [Mucilaginibacter sp. JRF]